MSDGLTSSKSDNLARRAGRVVEALVRRTCERKQPSTGRIAEEGILMVNGASSDGFTHGKDGYGLGSDGK